MDLDPQVSPYKTSDRTSFAYASARDRWPVIITGAIDDVHRSTGNTEDETMRKEGKSIIEGLAKLKYELQHDRQLTPIPDDGKPDVEGYNQELTQLGSPTWFSVPWLYAECYLYRRIATFFSLSTKWKNYDIFSRQKLSTFKSSRPAVIELALRYRDLVAQLEKKHDPSTSPEESAKAEELLFTEICEISLWGNATDLSLLTTLSYDDIQKLQGSAARKASESKILANDFPAAFAALKRSQKAKPNAERRVDIILDNAGFELFVDLVLAGYLLAAGLATTVVLHPKTIPWFVSDVIPADFGALLNALADPESFYASDKAPSGSATPSETPDGALTDDEAGNLHFLFGDWSQLHAAGKLVIRPHAFWTHAGSYWRLPTLGPSVYAALRTSELVVFKGDLNYRKLTGDVEWAATTPFREAIGPLGRAGEGLRVLALRTCKADVVVGLGEGVDQRVRAAEGGEGEDGARRWAWSGKWAVVQFCDGRDG